MSFSSDVQKFNLKVTNNCEKVFRGTAIGLFGNIIKRTPVETGRAKGNWQIDINNPASGASSEIDNTPIGDISGGSALKLQADTRAAKLGDSIYMVNNLPYAGVLERGRVGNKGSIQAANGMVAVSVAEFQNEIDKQARANK